HAARLLGRNGPRERGVDRLAVGAEDRDPHAGGRDGEVWLAEDLARLEEQLALLGVVAVLTHVAVVAEHVERDLVAEPPGRDRLAGQGGGRLLAQLLDAPQPGT